MTYINELLEGNMKARSLCRRYKLLYKPYILYQYKVTFIYWYTLYQYKVTKCDGKYQHIKNSFHVYIISSKVQNLRGKRYRGEKKVHVLFLTLDIALKEER